MEIRKLAALAFGLLALSVPCGCSLGRGSFIEPVGAVSQTPPGTCAVLRVTSAPGDVSKSTDMLWGKVDTANAERQFAELLVHAAREDGGLAVLTPFEADEKIERAGLRPTLQPDDEQLAQFAQALGCASYLTAQILDWHFDYMLFSSSAAVEFRLACRRTDTNEAVWESHVRREAQGISQRDAALLALRETFKSLKRQDGKPGDSHEAGGSL